MGIVNATPDSFSDRAGPEGPGRAGRARRCGWSRTARRSSTWAASPAAPTPRRCPWRRRSRAWCRWSSGWPPGRARLGGHLARPRGARRARGRRRDDQRRERAERRPALADACAEHGAALVVTHTRAAPKMKAFPDYDDVVRDVREFLAERMAAARAARGGRGRDRARPGHRLRQDARPSRSSCCAGCPSWRALGRPLLLAVSRKDFVGALTGRPPAARDAGTLAAVGAAVRGRRDASCACTTWPARATTCACATRSRRAPTVRRARARSCGGRSV